MLTTYQKLPVILGAVLLVVWLVPMADAQGLLPECREVPVSYSKCFTTCSAECRVGDASCNTACDEYCAIDPCGANHIVALIVNIYNWLLGLAALVGVLMIIWAGIQMILVSVFEVSPNELMATPLESAKLTLLRAVIGLIIIFLAYIIVNTALALLGVDASSAVGELLSDYGLLASPTP